jgi:hypothetical protein
MDGAWRLALALCSVTSGVIGVAACDTQAVGVDSCREIEYARCGAASHCPTTFKVTSPAACRRFYRDHCLHGLAIPTDPGPATVNPCVSDIKAIGACTAREGESASLLFRPGCTADGDPCCPMHEIGKYSKATSACTLLGDLENIRGCIFLNPVTPVVISDAGSDSGS